MRTKARESLGAGKGPCRCCCWGESAVNYEERIRLGVRGHERVKANGKITNKRIFKSINK